MNRPIWGVFILMLIALCACGEVETAVLPTTATASHTPQPTDTATATNTPTSIPTNTPTLTPTATATSTETATPKPTSTPKPTATPEPSSWDRYLPNTLANLFELTSEHLDTEQFPALYIEVSPEYQYPSQVEVIYTGEYREIDPVKQFLIETWGGTVSPQVGESIKGAFQQEILVIEADVEYWIPVQEVLVPFLKDELEPGDDALIFILWVGANITSADAPADRAFILNEFRARLP